MARKAPASKPPKFVDDPVAQDRDRLKRLKEVAEHQRGIESQIGTLKEELKSLREQKKEADRELYNLAANVPQGELFAQASKEMSGDE